MAIRALRCRVAAIATHGRNDRRQKRTYVCCCARNSLESSRLQGPRETAETFVVTALAVVQLDELGAGLPAGEVQQGHRRHLGPPWVAGTPGVEQEQPVEILDHRLVGVAEDH